jgi:serine/threonine protein kinase
MSVVYKAKDNASNRTVAIKILGDDKYLWRFKAEAELGYLLNMANVANTIRADLTGETLPNDMTVKYLVMKWISGSSLSDVIRNNRIKTVPTPELLTLAVHRQPAQESHACAGTHPRGKHHPPRHQAQ